MKEIECNNDITSSVRKTRRSASKHINEGSAISTRKQRQAAVLANINQINLTDSLTFNPSQQLGNIAKLEVQSSQSSLRTLPHKNKGKKKQNFSNQGDLKLSLLGFKRDKETKNDQPVSGSATRGIDGAEKSNKIGSVSSMILNSELFKGKDFYKNLEIFSSESLSISKDIDIYIEPDLTFSSKNICSTNIAAGGSSTLSNFLTSNRNPLKNDVTLNNSMSMSDKVSTRATFPISNQNMMKNSSIKSYFKTKESSSNGIHGCSSSESDDISKFINYQIKVNKELMEENQKLKSLNNELEEKFKKSSETGGLLTQHLKNAKNVIIELLRKEHDLKRTQLKEWISKNALRLCHPSDKYSVTQECWEDGLEINQIKTEMAQILREKDMLEREKKEIFHKINEKEDKKEKSGAFNGKITSILFDSLYKSKILSSLFQSEL